MAAEESLLRKNKGTGASRYASSQVRMEQKMTETLLLHFDFSLFLLSLSKTFRLSVAKHGPIFVSTATVHHGSGEGAPNDKETNKQIKATPNRKQ